MGSSGMTGSTDVPDVRYARSGGLSIAYQEFGDGPVDLVLVRGGLSDLDSIWEQPLFRRHVEGLARFSRVLLFDKRGTGLSDRLRDVSSLEDRMDDIRAVLEAVGSERAAFLGAHEGTRLAVLFASTYPERTRALVLYEPSVRGRRGPDYPWARSDDEWRTWLHHVGAGWGGADFFARMLRDYSPTVADDPDFLRWYVRHMRSSASPSAAVAFQRMVMEGDVTDILPSVRVPTLILHRPMSAGLADFVTRRIPGARRVEIPGLADGYSWANPAANQVLIDETGSFLRALDAPAEPESVLGTFLFTDIVGSTARAAALGDVAWRALLDRHHALVRQRLAQFRGIEAGTAGDGFFATFDGPGRAIRCACAIRDDVRTIGLEIRAGLHSGEGQLIDGQMSGLAVHIAARVAALAGANQVLVSGTVRDLVAGSGFTFEDRGVHALKGVPGDWPLFEVLAT